MPDEWVTVTPRLLDLLAIMERLRGVDGCPWDRVQTFASIAPYTVEESYEVADAIERGDMAHLRDELGDLLFQVVFHARIAEEGKWFEVFVPLAETTEELLAASSTGVKMPFVDEVMPSFDPFNPATGMGGLPPASRHGYLLNFANPVITLTAQGRVANFIRTGAP